jgi:hypothetical protein
MSGCSLPSYGPVWGWILTFPGAPMASGASVPGIQQPRPRLLLPAQQLRPPRPSALRTPPPPPPRHPATPTFQPCPPPWTESLRMRGPFQPTRFPNKSPFPPCLQCACDSAVEWAEGLQQRRVVGRVLLPSSFPLPLLLILQAATLIPCSAAQSTQPSILKIPPLLHNTSQSCPFT